MCSALPVAAALAVWVAGTPAHAASLALNFNNGVNTKGPFTNPGAAPVDTNFFQTTLNLDSGSQLQVAANVDLNISISANLGLTGATLSPTGNLNIPFQSPALSAAPTKISTTPASVGGSMGSASLTLWDQQVSGFDPGGDGGNPNPLATMPSTLGNADLTALKATLIGASGATLVSNPLTINGSGSLDISILGIGFTQGLDLQLIGNANATLKNLAFTQTSGDGLLGPGAPVGVPPQDESRNYFMLANGNIGGDVDLSVGGNMKLDAGLFGTFNFPLSNLVSSSQSLAAAFPLPGAVTLADLNPGGYNPVNYDDLQATIGLDLTNTSLPFSLASSGTAILSSAITTTFSTLGVNFSATVNVTGTVTFGLLASLLVQDTVYQLQDSVANVVAPEPGSIILLFLGVAGAVPLVLRRRRRKS
ncbi:MAG: PEP-CTERM sorting domain-containing protein [Pirellulales bacterium]|nr:PEP-CTERM sorting domain-containing protein [Pirellulales bacterium]